MLLGTDVSSLLTAVSICILPMISLLVIAGIIPLRRWIRQEVLDRMAEVARRFLDELPGRVMAIDATESRHETNLEEAVGRKAQIQRDADRIGAVDGAGRLLYLLPKSHLVRITLQFIGGTVVVGLRSRSTLPKLAAINLAFVAVDVLMVIAPYLLWIVVQVFVRSPAFLTVIVPGDNRAEFPGFTVTAN